MGTSKRPVWLLASALAVLTIAGYGIQAVSPAPAAVPVATPTPGPPFFGRATPVGSEPVWHPAPAAVPAAVSPAKAPAPSSGGVPWKDYAADLKGRIDSAATAKDCRTLQKAFNDADAGNTATRSRTGHSNSDLMVYIDRAMRGAGCYSK